MSRDQEIAQELAKLASLMVPGVEDEIGADDSFQVHDNSDRSLEVHNHNFSGMKHVKDMPASLVLPQEDWNPPSLAEVQQRADAVYGDQSHNLDFYPKGLDAISDLLMGHSPVVASKRKLARVSSNYSAEYNLVMDIAQELAKFASSVAPGREDTIGFNGPRNEGPTVADRIDSNKSLESVRAVARHQSPAPVTEYGQADFNPSMDTGGFLGSMGVQASSKAPVTKKKANLVNSSFAKQAGSMHGNVRDFMDDLSKLADPRGVDLQGTFHFSDGRLALYKDGDMITGLQLFIAAEKTKTSSVVKKKQ